VGRVGFAALAEVAFEPFKEIGPVAGADDKHIAAVVLIAFAPEIAECAKRVQGASDHRLGHPQGLGKTADRVRAGCQIDQHQQRHLAVGEVWLAGTDVGNQRLHPTV